MVASTREQFNIHPEWLKIFPEEFASAIQLVESLDNYQPDKKYVFKVFESDPAGIRVVVVGQDPYPTSGDATGLAFSVNRSQKLPKSLQNIFKELQKIGRAHV